jgi:hypothetical protein
MKRYKTFNSYLKEKFQAKVYKIALDARFSCPNRDGTLSQEGCIYCRQGSAAGYINKDDSLDLQVKSRIKRLKKVDKDAKFIVYFQAFSNTYASLADLKKAYDQALAHKDIIGLSIGTRPDCVDKEKIELIASYSPRYEVWVEYGLQSIHKKTLEFIGRGHSSEDFLQAIDLTQNKGIKICAHIILGLPEETRKEIMETVKLVSNLNIQGIKIHLLHVLKDTPLEKIYLKGDIKLLSMDEYISLVCDILELLPKDMIIQRVTGEGDKDIHIAPLWALEKAKVLQGIDRELVKRDSHQGKKYS